MSFCVWAYYIMLNAMFPYYGLSFGTHSEQVFGVHNMVTDCRIWDASDFFSTNLQ